MEEKCHPLLRPLINIVEMIGAALGPDYEVLLHDVSSGEPLTLAAANSRLSGRDRNSPMSDFGRFLMESLEAEKVDYIANYPSEAANGRQMRSSVSLIRDEEGRLVGFLCVNYDMSRAKMLKDISDFLTKTHPIALGGMRVEKFTKAAGEDDLLEKADPEYHAADRQPQAEEVFRPLHALGQYVVTVLIGNHFIAVLDGDIAEKQSGNAAENRAGLLQRLWEVVRQNRQAQMRMLFQRDGSADIGQNDESQTVELLHPGEGGQEDVTRNDVDKRQHRHNREDNRAKIILQLIEKFDNFLHLDPLISTGRDPVNCLFIQVYGDSFEFGFSGFPEKP